MAALRSLAFAQTVAPRLRMRGSRMLFGSSQRLQRQATRGAAAQQPTYGEVFNVQGDIREKPITPEDTARMRAVESATVGQTVKGGTAAKMQSALDKAGVKSGGGAGIDVDDIGLPSSPLPTLDEVGSPGPDGFVQVDPELAEVLAAEGTEEPITIGEALEAAAENIGDKPIEPKDVRVIQSAESRATGNTPGVKRVVAAEAQAALNTATVHDVLSNASEKMEMDKVVTKEDAARVQAAERRSSPTGQVEPGGIAATVQSAADRNIATGVAPDDGSGGRIRHGQ